MSTLRIFIGSASENKQHAKDIQDVLHGENVETLGWWDKGVFPASSGILDSLFEAAKKTNAALFVASGNDLVLSRGRRKWSLRDNVLFEYGLFAGVQGRGRTALALIPQADGEIPDLPVDLGGIITIRLSNAATHADFVRMNRTPIRDWIEEISKAPSQTETTPLPLLWQSMLRVLGHRKQGSPEWAHQIDLLASELLEPIVMACGEDYGINDDLEHTSRVFLQQCSSLHAVDVLGPQGWINPAVYRYLARQIRHYIKGNTVEIKENGGKGSHSTNGRKAKGAAGNWRITLSPGLSDAIRRAIKRAKSHSILGQSILKKSMSDFDQGDLTWRSGRPVFEFARILLWTRDELMNKVGESIIAIHEAFHIPLFFRETPRSDRLREVDYLYFKMPNGLIEGFYGIRENRYKTEVIKKGQIPRLGDVAVHYEHLLSDSKLLLAADAWQIFKEEQKFGNRSRISA